VHSLPMQTEFLSTCRLTYASEQSNVLYNITKWVTLPASVGKGPSLITASLFSLFGAASAPTLSNYNVSITVGDFTSSNYVSSKP